MLYHVIAKNCMTQKMIASPFLFHQNTAHSVKARQSSITMVAISLVGSNMRFSCFSGPMRKQVLARAVIFPRV